MTIQLNNSNEVMLGGIASNKNRLSRVHAKFLVDGTGSTGLFTPGVEAVIKDVVQELPARLGEFYCGLHVGRDIEYDRDHDINLGDDLAPDELIKQLSLIKYEGGGDELETQIDSVIQVAQNTAWKSSEGSRLAIVLATSSGSKNARDGSDAAKAGMKLAALGIKVIVIAPPTASNIHDLASYSGGISLALSNTPSQDDLKLLRSLLTKSLTQIAGSPSAGTIGLGLKPSFGSNGTVAI